MTVFMLNNESETFGGLVYLDQLTRYVP